MQLAGAIGAAGVAGLAGPQAVGAASETQADVTPQPTLSPSPEMNTSDILVETLIAWGAPFQRAPSAPCHACHAMAAALASAYRPTSGTARALCGFAQLCRARL